MKKLYYFSKSKLQFVEIKNYKTRLVLFFALGIFIFSTLIFGGYFILESLLNSDKSIAALKSENELLNRKLKEIAVTYQRLSKSLDSLNLVNNELRIASNLPPISDEERKVGVGGGFFDNALDFLKGETKPKLGSILSFVDEVARKLEFERQNYSEITDKLKENSKLFEAIPAIRPSTGVLAQHGFGIRLHPILRIRQMHEGIDIITDVGTQVYASGKGVVDFVGYKGGFGLAVEINHGFGYRTIYAHLSRIKVREGQQILRGDLIAYTGNSGLSTGPHLHYEVLHNGENLDPMGFFFDDLGFFELAKKK